MHVSAGVFGYYTQNEWTLSFENVHKIDIISFHRNNEVNNCVFIFIEKRVQGSRNLHAYVKLELL